MQVRNIDDFKQLGEDAENAREQGLNTSDSQSTEQEKYNQLERDFNVFLTMDEKDDKLDKQINDLENEHNHLPKIYQNLENLFKQEVPSDSLFKIGAKISQKQKEKLSSPEFHIENPPYVSPVNKNPHPKKTPISPFDDDNTSSPEHNFGDSTYPVKFPDISDTKSKSMKDFGNAHAMPFSDQGLEMEGNQGQHQQQQSPFGMMQMSEMNPYYSPYQQVNFITN